MDILREKEIAALWSKVEARGKEWQKSLSLGCMVMPLYEMRKFWNALATLQEQPRYQLKLQTLEYENARLKAEVALLRNILERRTVRLPAELPAELMVQQKKAAHSN